MLSLIIPLAIAFFGFLGQSTGAAPTTGFCAKATACNGRLEGVVTLEGGGFPAGASLFLQPLIGPRPTSVGEYVVRDDDIAAMSRGHFHGIVDEAGRVRIGEVRPGRYILVIQVPGYISPESFPWTLEPSVSGHAVSERTDNTVTVRAGATTTFHLKLQHGGTIAGIVSSSESRSAHRDVPFAEQVALTLLTRRADGYFQHTAVGAEHTDADGRFTFANLPPGDYVIMTVIPGPMVRTAEGQLRVMGGLIFSGGTSSLEKASVVHVVGTETENTELVLPTRGLCDVSGRVFAPDGSSLTQGLVHLKPVDDDPSRTFPISAAGSGIASDGSFQFYSMLPNRYEIWIELQPKITFVGMTDDHQGIRMRSTPPPPYTSPHVLVDCTSGVTEPIVLQLKSGNTQTPAPAR
jgi:hypothetical protein